MNTRTRCDCCQDRPSKSTDKEIIMPELEKPGGVSFEVVLEGAKKTDQPSVKCPSTPTPTVKDIEKKLKVLMKR